MTHTVCPMCGAGFDTTPVGVMFTYVPCDPCAKYRMRVDIPALFRKTDIRRLPQGQYTRTKEWRPDETGRGLILVGPSGAGKSRCMWELVKGLSGIELRVFDCVAFGHELAQHYRAETAEEWLMNLGTRTPVVFFDDLGKLKLTERVEAELFGVIDRRVSHMLPIIATTQLSGEDLKDLSSSNRGGALIRRLSESCDIVQF